MKYAIAIIAALALAGCFRASEAHEPRCWYHKIISESPSGVVRTDEALVGEGGHQWVRLDTRSFTVLYPLGGGQAIRVPVDLIVVHSWAESATCGASGAAPQSAQEIAAEQDPPDLTGAQ